MVNKIPITKRNKTQLEHTITVHKSRIRRLWKVYDQYVKDANEDDAGLILQTKHLLINNELKHLRAAIKQLIKKAKLDCKQ